LAERLVAMAHRPMRLEADPALQRPVEVPVLRGSFTKLEKITGWHPEIPLDQTLTDVLDDWRSRGLD
jgi:GDP-4-dehydro-6-deoxy-D-mannose reductase